MITTLLLFGAVLVGITHSSNYGETPFALEAEARARVSVLEVSARYNSSGKDITQGQGWVGRGTADLRLGRLLGGLSYTHRNMGDHSRESWWIRGGVEIRGALVYGEWNVGETNYHEKSLGIRIPVYKKPLTELEAGPTFYGYNGLKVGWHTRIKVGVGR